VAVAVATDLDLDLALPRAAPVSNRAAAFAWRAWNATWPKLLAIGIVIGGWQLAVYSHHWDEFLVPSPFTVLDRLFHEPGTMVTASLVTLRRGVQGFVIAMVIGAVVGIAVARVKILRAAIGSMITGLQTMPSVAWVPLAIILFKEGQGTVTFVVVIGAAPSIANGIISGVDHVPPLLLRAGRVLGARGIGALRHVVIPAALPAVVGGLKQGWAFAWRSLMAAELIGGLSGKLGIGQLLNGFGAQADYVGVFEAMIVILIIGILVDALVFGTVDRAIRRRYGLIDAATI
jgi:NitT/TauT family transport system permease protein